MQVEVVARRGEGRFSMDLQAGPTHPGDTMLTDIPARVADRSSRLSEEGQPLPETGSIALVRGTLFRGAVNYVRVTETIARYGARYHVGAQLPFSAEVKEMFASREANRKRRNQMP